MKVVSVAAPLALAAALLLLRPQCFPNAFALLFRVSTVERRHRVIHVIEVQPRAQPRGGRTAPTSRDRLPVLADEYQLGGSFASNVLVDETPSTERLGQVVSAQLRKNRQAAQPVTDTRFLGQSRNRDENLIVQNRRGLVASRTPSSNTLLLGREGW